MPLINRLINSQLFSFIWYTVRRIKTSALLHFFSLYPIENGKVLFQSFSGQSYSDNPKAISEALYNSNLGYKIVWGLKDIKNVPPYLPSYVKVVKSGSLSWYKEMATSEFWVVNDLMKDGTIKRKKQKYIQTWHGDRGFKKIVNDMMHENGDYKKKNRFRRLVEPDILDLGLTGSEFGEKIYRSAFSYKGKLLKTGCPRNDCLLHITNDAILLIKKQLGIPENAKIFMYAPTFRDHQSIFGNEQEKDSFNMAGALDALELKTGEKWVGILRGHPGTKLPKDFGNSNGDNRVYNMSDYNDMADLLIITDFLLTDYSSTPGDFALTKRISVLFHENTEKFVENNRALYFDLDKAPFLIAHSQQELLTIINNFTMEGAKENAEAILSFYGTYETGKSTERVIEYIISNSL